MGKKTPKSASNMKVTAQTVNVTGSKTVSSGKNTSRPKQPKASKQKAKVVREIESGMMTNQDSGPMSLRQARAMKCTMSPSEEGFFYKHIDPAGSVETYRAIGESSKIPDGLVTFSVDAEIRVIKTLSVPRSSTSEIALSGDVWSLVILSFPMYRIAWIAVANVFNKEISDPIAAALVQELNSLYNYDSVINDDNWIPFAGIDDGWYYKVQVLPPTYDNPDPIGGTSRTVTDWRMAYKSITCESNAPALVDQGLIVGGHYALSATTVAEPTENVEAVETSVLFRRNVLIPGVFKNVNTAIPNLAKPTVVAAAPANGGEVFFDNGQGVLGPALTFDVVLDYSNETTQSFQYRLLENNTWYSAPGVLFAEPLDIVQFVFGTTDAEGTFMVINNLTTVATSPLVTRVGPEHLASATRILFMDLPSLSEVGGTAKTIELPAFRTDQIAANNPKMEQFQMHESGGGYLVHRKIRNPVFQLTPAQSYGPVIFTSPGSGKAMSNGTGLLDTIDANFSTGVMVMTGIAWANAPILKLYQGWEGVTNTNTALGQFGHAGLPANTELLALIDSMNTMTTGFYPAKDNFAAALCMFGASLLKGLFKSEATQGMMRHVAGMAVNKGMDMINNVATKALR